MRNILAVTLCVAALPLLAATEPNPSKKQREIVEELMEVTNIKDVEVQLADTILAQVHEKLVGGNADLSPELREEAKKDSDRLRELIRNSDMHGALREMYISLYAKYFTEQELRDLVAFYRTSTGQKAMKVLPQLMAESMAKSEDVLGPIFENAWKQVEEERDKRKPWRKTMANMRTLATALEARATDENQYPNTTLSGLKELLEPTYIKTMPMKDTWGNEFAYIGSADGNYYRIVSAGADGIFEWDSRKIVLEERVVRYSENLKDDIIYADGDWVQMPAVARPDEDQ